MDEIYLLDTNIFIQAKNSYYAFDIAPSFWNKLNQVANNDAFLVIDHVKRELTKSRTNPDDIHNWIKDDFSGDIASTNDPLVMEKYQEVITRVQTEHLQGNDSYDQPAIDRFLEFDNADTWLIAYALAYNCKIVTFEKYSPNAVKSVKIPNVCEILDIEYLDLFQFMREVGIAL